MTSAYDEAYARSMDDPEGFWGEAAEAIDWYKRWDKVLDRKSTRLNSSHVVISYAVFCLKKKKNT